MIQTSVRRLELVRIKRSQDVCSVVIVDSGAVLEPAPVSIEEEIAAAITLAAMGTPGDAPKLLKWTLIPFRSGARIKLPIKKRRERVVLPSILLRDPRRAITGPRISRRRKRRRNKSLPQAAAREGLRMVEKREERKQVHSFLA